MTRLIPILLLVSLSVLVGFGTTICDGIMGAVPPTGNTAYVKLTEEQREALREATECTKMLDKLLGNHSEITPVTIRGVLIQVNLAETFNRLVETNLVNRVVWLGEEQKRFLAVVLWDLYGPGLKNYPCLEGRVYLLYVVYYNID